MISASAIVAILCTFFGDKGGVSEILKVICGIFLTLVVINPLVKLDFSAVLNYLEYVNIEGMEAASAGENMAREAEGDIIKSRVQAYILDKADSCGVQLDVEVILDQDNIPVSVELSGRISPNAKAQISEMITENLGITKEHQLWIG